MPPPRSIADLTEPEMREQLAALRLKIAQQGHLSVEELDRADRLFQMLGEFDELYRHLDRISGPTLIAELRRRDDHGTA